MAAAGSPCSNCTAVVEVVCFSECCCSYESSYYTVLYNLQILLILLLLHNDNDDDDDVNAASGMETGEKNKDRDSWKRCAELAIAWNSVEVARNNIFNTENRYHYQVTAPTNVLCELL